VIPRQYFPSSQFSVQKLLVFADASIKAYGAVAYFRQDNCISLIMSKTRESPLKTISLPRLELMAAVLATRLAKFILSSIKCQCTVHLWPDNQIVLYWVNSSKKLKLFVCRHINEITSAFPTTVWQYCPTSDNSADLLTDKRYYIPTASFIHDLETWPTMVDLQDSMTYMESDREHPVTDYRSYHHCLNY